MNRKYFYFFIGTTAELIKLAPIIREYKRRSVAFKVITSGQNKVLFGEFKKFFGKVKSNIVFPEKGKRSSIPFFSLWAIRTFFLALFRLKDELRGLNKDRVFFIVHGDTVSSLIGAIVAKFYGLNLVHVESGLRSFNFFEPFPEEISRFIISGLADIHFCPNEWSRRNLKNVGGVKVNTMQNTLVESYLIARGENKNFQKYEKIKGKYFVFVMHRQEHVLFEKENSKRLMMYILANAPKNLFCVFIVHAISLNFWKSLESEISEEIKSKVVLLPRVPYINFIKLMENSEFLATDGGSNQEEGYYMGKPTLILRNRTERVEGLGQSVVLGKGNTATIRKFLKSYSHYKRTSLKARDLVSTPSKMILDFLLQS
jgi:UDP-N-acetylglucosamine 2-epimerase (non-hydrolysing)